MAGIEAVLLPQGLLHISLMVEMKPDLIGLEMQTVVTTVPVPVMHLMVVEKARSRRILEEKDKPNQKRSKDTSLTPSMKKSSRIVSISIAI